MPYPTQSVSSSSASSRGYSGRDARGTHPPRARPVMGEFPPHSKYNAGGSSQVQGNNNLEFPTQQYSTAFNAQGRNVGGAYQPTTARPNLRPHGQKPNAGHPGKSSSASSSDSLNAPTPVISGRVDKTPSPKKRGGKSRSVHRDAAIKTPLSSLTAQFPDVDIADIESFVSRTTEERHIELEAGKKPGMVKRPMNAFMLYRKAYQKLAKAACSQKNHQFVSQICGDSWAIESMSVRDQFNAWAVTERVNHHTAHPEYKFSSTKSWDKISIDDDKTEIENRDADIDLGPNLGGVSPSSSFSGSYQSPYGPYYGLPPSQFQVAPMAYNATSFPNIGAFGGQTAYNPMAFSQPTYMTPMTPMTPMTGPYFHATSESPFLGAPAPNSSFGSIMGSPISPGVIGAPFFPGPTGNTFLGASTQGSLVNANPGAIVGAQQAEPAMPMVKVNRPPPLSTFDGSLQTDDYARPTSMEVTKAPRRSQNEEEPTPKHTDNELGALETVNDDMQANQELLNMSRDWVSHSPVHGNFDMMNGLGQERDFPSSILDSSGNNTISV